MKPNTSDYSILSIFALIYIGVIYRYHTTPKYLVLSTIVFAIIYIFWGVYHQLRVKIFNGRVVLEYFLVAILGVAIVCSLLV